jgi:hypothetical protein
MSSAMHHSTTRNPLPPAIFIIIVGWLAFIASFFLPATNVVERGGAPPGTALVGWDAAVSSVQLVAAQPLVIFAEPKALLFLLFPLINLVALLSPLVALSNPTKAAWLAIVLVPVAAMPLTMPKPLVGDLFIGFYFWSGSFLVMGIGYIVVGLTSSSVLSETDDT